MKNITTTICLLFMFINCKAQTLVFDISKNFGTENPTGAYYKDTQNLLNPFVGTFVYTNGTTSFKIELKKKEMSSVNGRYYEDLIVGAFKYVENGVQKVNTLGSLMLNQENGWKYPIHGSLILDGKELGCDECTDTEKRLRISISDDSADRIGKLDIRRIIHNGQQAIKVDLWWDVDWRRRPTDPVIQPARIPSGTYIMIKQ